MVSADEYGFVNIYDIETGKIMSKFNATDPNYGNVGEKVVKEKVTAGCFDMQNRRLIISAEGGYVKIWNFSNGSVLKSIERDLSNVPHIQKWSQ